MKQKLFTLLTLLVLCVTGAQAGAPSPITYKEFNAGVTYYPFTSDNATAAISGNWMNSGIDAIANKNGNINPATGESCSSTSFPGVRAKQKGAGDNRSCIFYITGASEITVYGVTASGDTNRKIWVVAEPTSGSTVKDSEVSAPGVTASVTVSLDKTKSYKIFCCGTNESSTSESSDGADCYMHGFKITVPAAAGAPADPTYTVDGGDVYGSTTTTIASTNATKIYYAWTASATAPEKGDVAYSEANGGSYEFTIPNTTANMYLHAYGWNNYNSGSTSNIKSSLFNVTKRSTAAKSYNFSGAFTDAMKEALEADNFVWDGDALRYKSKAKIDKDTDNDLGTYSGVTEWNGLVFGRTGNDITASNLRIQENGYIQINGGNGYYKLEGLYDGDIVKIRCASASSNAEERTFTVTGATPSSISVNSSNAGYHDFTLTKSGNGDLTIKQSNGINVWTIAINTDLPAVPTVAVSTATGNTYATVVTSYALDFSTVSEDITAYIVTEKGANTVTTEAVTKVPASTAILVKTASAGAKVDVPRASGATALSTNKLKYSASPIEVNTTNDNVGKIYAFFKVAGQYGFAPVAEDTTLPANKAYLEIDGGALQANFLALDLDGETTAINEVKGMKTNTKGEYFNLAGQRVAQPTKGLYIVNGRKVVIR